MENLLARIEIKTPCSESWDDMIGNEQVRFCSHCAKNVYDISAMTRARAEELILNSKGNLCARYLKVERTVIPVRTAPIRITRRAAIAASVLAGSLTLSSLTSAQNAISSPPLKPARPAASQATPLAGDSIGVSGLIQDSNDAVIPGANVILRNTRTGKTRSTTSDTEGIFVFKDVDAGDYELEIAADGFTPLSVPGLKLTESVALTQVLNPAGVIEELLGVVAFIESVILSTEDPPTASIQIRSQPHQPLIPNKRLGTKKKNLSNLPN